MLLTLDTTRADHLGCYGSKQSATPVLDRLASRGIRFENAQASAPITLPAHASILMGLNPPPQARTPKPAPAAAAAPPPAAAPTVDPAQQAASECMAGNAQKNEKEVQRLGEAAAAAANAGDVAKAMVYADSINRLQTAGCNQ